MNNGKQIKVLFVCMGNICRSPTAEGVFNKLLEDKGASARFHVDSAGTIDYHVGNQPDSRAQKAARQRNIDLSTIRARKVMVEDFTEFDYLLAMDEENYANMIALCPDLHQHKVKLFLDYAPHRSESEVPDPYFGGTNGFEKVLDLVEEASLGLYKAILDKDTVR